MSFILGEVYAKIAGKYIPCTQSIEDLENEIKSLRELLNTKKYCGTCKYFRAEKNFCICIGQHAQHDFGCVYHDCL